MARLSFEDYIMKGVKWFVVFVTFIFVLLVQILWFLPVLVLRLIPRFRELSLWAPWEWYTKVLGGGLGTR